METTIEKTTKYRNNEEAHGVAKKYWGLERCLYGCYIRLHYAKINHSDAVKKEYEETRRWCKVPVYLEVIRDCYKHIDKLSADYKKAYGEPFIYCEEKRKMYESGKDYVI